MKKYYYVPFLMLAALGTAGAQNLSISPNPLNLPAQAGATQVQGTLNFTSTGTPITFNIVPNQGWLQVSPAGGTTPLTVTVTANPSVLQPGSNQGSLAIFYGSTGATVPVNVSVSTIGVSPQSVALGNFQAGSTAYPAAQTIAVSGGNGAFQIAKAPADNWYTAAIVGSPASGVRIALDQTVAASLTPATYNGTLTITPTGVASPVSVNVPISLVVTAAPVVTVSPASGGLSFNWQLGGSNNQTQQTIQLASNASSAINFALSPQGSWIALPAANPASIQPAGTQVTIGVNGATLQPGSYDGKVTVVVSGAVFANGSGSLDIPVHLTVSTSPFLFVDKSALSFSYQFNSGLAVPPASVTPGSTAAPLTQLQYGVATTSAASWLVMPVGAQTTGTPISISVSPGSLAPGTYSTSILFSTVPASGQQAQTVTIPVTLTVTNTPTLTVTPDVLVFPYQTGQAVPAAQAVTISTNSGAPLNYSVAAPNVSWLQVGGKLTGTTDQTSLSISVTPPTAPALLDATIAITATDPVTGAAAGSASIDVKLYVASTPLLTVTPAGPIVLKNGQLVTVGLGSTSPTDQLTIGGPIQYNGSWISSTQTPAATPGSVSLSAVPGNTMTPGTYPGSMTITATGPGGAAVADSPLTVPIVFQYNAATGTVSPDSLTFLQATGGTPPAAKQVSVQTGGVPLPFSAVVNDGGINWLSVSSATGVTPNTFNVGADASKLTSGTYYGAVYVTIPNAAGSPFRIPVTFTVSPGTISVPANTALNFMQVAGSTTPPAPQSLQVLGTPAPLTFSVSVSTKDGASWLSAKAATGTTNDTVQVSVSAGSLAAGTYNGTVTITASGASASALGSPIAVPVTLTVVPPQTLAASPSTLNFSYVLGTAGSPLPQAVQITASGSAQFTVATSSGASWLKVSPTSGTAPASLSVSVDPTGLAANTYTGTLTVSSPSAVIATTVTVNLNVVAVPPPVIAAVKNAASWTTGAISPGENIIIGGTGLGPATLAQPQVAAAGPFPTTISDTQVLFDNTIAAPILYAWGPQTSVMVPYEIAGQPTVTIRVVYKGVQSDPLTYNVVPAAPGIYTQNSQGFGPGAILNQDFKVNGPGAAAPTNSVVAVYMTGEGVTQPASITGGVAPVNGAGLNKPPLNVSATVSGLLATVEYYGSAPGIVYGVMQVNVRIPANTPSGPQAIVITLGTSNTAASYSTQQGVTVTVQ